MSQSPFDAGYQAFEAGKTLNDNPHPSGEAYNSWMSGFDQAEVDAGEA